MISALTHSGIFWAVLVVAVVHALLPTHWLSFVLVARAQGWTKGRMLRLVLLSGAGHVTATAAVGLLAAALGKDLQRSFRAVDTPISALILLAFGLYYLVMGWRREGHRHCDHDHAQDPIPGDRAVAGALFLEMTLSPCETLIPLFFAAGTFSWPALLMTAVLMSLLTIGVMGLLAWVGYSGYEKLTFPWLERNERVVLGVFLILLGGATYFLR